MRTQVEHRDNSKKLQCGLRRSFAKAGRSDSTRLQSRLLVVTDVAGGTSYPSETYQREEGRASRNFAMMYLVCKHNYSCGAASICWYLRRNQKPQRPQN